MYTLSCEEDKEAKDTDIKLSRSTWGLVYCFKKPRNYSTFFDTIKNKLENTFIKKDGETKIRNYIFQVEKGKYNKLYLYLAIQFKSFGEKPYLRLSNLFSDSYIILPHNYDKWKIFCCKEENRIPDTEPQFFLEEDEKLKNTYTTNLKINVKRKQKLINEDVKVIKKIRAKILKIDPELISDEEYKIYKNYCYHKSKILNIELELIDNRNIIGEKNILLDKYHNPEYNFLSNDINYEEKINEIENEINKLEVISTQLINKLIVYSKLKLGDYIINELQIKIPNIEKKKKLKLIIKNK